MINDMETKVAEHQASKSDENSARLSVESRRRVATLLDLRVGTEVNVRAWPDELDLNLHSVIYRLLEVDGESDYAGPFMVDAEGIVRVAGLLDEDQQYAFIIEALSSDGEHVQSEIQTLSVADILESRH